MKKLLLTLFLIDVLIVLMVPILAFNFTGIERIFATGGEINWVNVDAPNNVMVWTRWGFSGVPVDGKNATVPSSIPGLYNGTLGFWAKGYLTKMRTITYRNGRIRTFTEIQPVTLAIVPSRIETVDGNATQTGLWNGTANCFDFDASRVYCNSTGTLVISNSKNELYFRKELNTYRWDIDITDGKVNIAGGDVWEDVFRVTGMEIKVIKTT